MLLAIVFHLPFHWAFNYKTIDNFHYTRPACSTQSESFYSIRPLIHFHLHSDCPPTLMLALGTLHHIYTCVFPHESRVVSLTLSPNQLTNFNEKSIAQVVGAHMEHIMMPGGPLINHSLTWPQQHGRARGKLRLPSNYALMGQQTRHNKINPLPMMTIPVRRC